MNAPTPTKPRHSRWMRRPLWWWRRNARARRLADHPPIVVTSIPKSGTHLIQSTLRAIGYRHHAHQPWNPDVRLTCDLKKCGRGVRALKTGEFVSDHLAWSEPLADLLRARGVRAVFVYRDPRAVCWSFVQYHLNRPFRFGQYLRSLSDMRSRVEAVIDGISDEHSEAGVGRAPLEQQYQAFGPWRSQPDVLSFSFEDLVGSQGGGDDRLQINCIRRLLGHLGLSRDEAQITSIARSSFNPEASNFRKGHIHSWREEADPETIHWLEARLGPLAASWGYSI